MHHAQFPQHHPLLARLVALPYEAIANATGFVRRTPRGITPLAFLAALCLEATGSAPTLAVCAMRAALVSGQSVSREAFRRRLGAASTTFLQQCLAAAVALAAATARRLTPCRFRRILVQDSTIIGVPAHLHRVFPGSRNHTQARPALLKIQAIYDLLSDRFVALRMDSYRRNDQAAAADILAVAEPCDLILRDLGYFVLAIFQRMGARGIDFLSRWRYGTQLFDATSGEPLDLLRVLRRQGSVDCMVLLGRETKLPVRLVALPVAAQVAAARRRALNCNSDRRCQPSATHRALMNWCIFITSVPPERLPAEHIAALYGLRWRIETIFKLWKSCFAIAVIHRRASAAQVRAFLYARLIALTLMMPLFHGCCEETAGTVTAPQISLLKFTFLFHAVLPFLACCAHVHLPHIMSALASHARYDKRRRPHHLAKRAVLS